jgi:amidase
MPAADSESLRAFRRAGAGQLSARRTRREFGLSPTPSRCSTASRTTPGGPISRPAARAADRRRRRGRAWCRWRIATDGGGSIRNPASACGLFGLKPTRARITSGPEGARDLSGLAAQHVVSAACATAPSMLDAIAGPMPGDPYTAVPPARPFLERDSHRTRAAAHRVREGGARRRRGGPGLRRGGGRCRAGCGESLGHHVEEASPDHDAQALEQVFRMVFLANTMANIARVTGGAMPHRALVEPLTYALAERGAP